MSTKNLVGIDRQGESNVIQRQKPLQPWKAALFKFRQRERISIVFYLTRILTTIFLLSVSSAPMVFADSKHRDEVRFHCEFAQVIPPKTEGVPLKCRARGQMNVKTLIGFNISFGDLNRFRDYFRFTCVDNDDRPFYYGPISFGISPKIVDIDGDNGNGDEFTAHIAGFTTTAPLIVISDIHLKHIKHREDRMSVATFSLAGTIQQLPGVCHLEPELDAR